MGDAIMTVQVWLYQNLGFVLLCSVLLWDGGREQLDVNGISGQCFLV